MKPVHHLLTAVGLCSALFATAAGAESLTILVENITASDGNIRLALSASQAQFDGKTTPIVSTVRRAQAGTMTFPVPELPGGEYAVRVAHDRNGNGKLDSNFVGVPTEPWAMSNNPSGGFGRPSWDQAKFHLDGAVTKSLTLSP